MGLSLEREPGPFQDRNAYNQKNHNWDLIEQGINKNAANLNSAVIGNGGTIEAKPDGVYATLADLQAAKPTGDTGVYLNLADGHWYYWNGSAWTDGGVYQAIQIADGSVSLAKLAADSVDLSKMASRTIQAIRDADRAKEVEAIDCFIGGTPSIWKKPVMSEVDPANMESGHRVINVNPSITYQQFLGVGAALTDSAAWLLWNKMTVNQRHCLLEELFSPNQAGLSALRICFGSSDFSHDAYYTYDELPDGVDSDPDMQYFSIGTGDPGATDATKDLRYIIPILQEILSINPHVKVIAAPWTAPTWMKDNKKIEGGNFVYTAENATAYATYIVKAIDAYKQFGIPICAVSPQNEPTYSRGYPSCVWKPEDLGDFSKNYLSKLLYEHQDQARIIGNDTNFLTTSDYVGNIFTDDTAPYIDVLGYHTYSGSVFLARDVMKKYHPQLWMTERRCIADDSQYDQARIMVGEIATAGIRHGVSLITLWNLALDEQGLPNGGATLGRRGVVTIQSDGSGKVTRNLEYYMLRALSQNVLPGAKRIGTESYNTSGDARDISSVAFVNPNGDIVVLVANIGGGRQAYLRLGGKVYQMNLGTYGFRVVNFGKYFDKSFPAGDGVIPDLPHMPRIESYTAGGEMEITQRFKCQAGETALVFISRDNYGASSDSDVGEITASFGLDGAIDAQRIDWAKSYADFWRISEVYQVADLNEGINQLRLESPELPTPDFTGRLNYVISFVMLKGVQVKGTKKFESSSGVNTVSISNTDHENDIVLSVVSLRKADVNFNVPAGICVLSNQYKASSGVGVRQLILAHRGNIATSLSWDDACAASVLNVYVAS